MNFVWQQSRNAALYVNTGNNQIYGRITWQNEDRLQLFAEYTGPMPGGKTATSAGQTATHALGLFTTDQAAKDTIEAHVNALFPAKEQAQNAART